MGWGYFERPCGGLPLVKYLKNLFLKIGFFKRGTEGKRENRRVTEAITETGAGMATGAGTGNVFDPSKAGGTPH
jgi:hypothetical protein